MNWQDTLLRIESPELDAELNFASGTSAFFRRVGKERMIQDALQLMNTSGEVCEEVFGNICDLSTRETDPAYQNPNDTPLAVLLWLTYFAAPHLAHASARFVDKAPRCWYAQKLAQGILNPTRVTSSDSLEHFGNANQISHRNSSTVRIIDLVSPATRVRASAVPSIEAPTGTVLETDRHVPHWGLIAGSDISDSPPSFSVITAGNWDPSVNAERRWYRTQESSGAEGVGP